MDIAIILPIKYYPYTDKDECAYIGFIAFCKAKNQYEYVLGGIDEKTAKQRRRKVCKFLSVPEALYDRILWTVKHDMLIMYDSLIDRNLDMNIHTRHLIDHSKESTIRFGEPIATIMITDLKTTLLDHAKHMWNMNHINS